MKERISKWPERQKEDVHSRAEEHVDEEEMFHYRAMTLNYIGGFPAS